MQPRTRATIDDLHRVPDNAKAELVNGELVLMAPTGDAPGYAGDAILASLWEFCRRTGYGRAIGDNKGFRVQLPHRESFSPDAALWLGQSSGLSEAVVRVYRSDDPANPTRYRRGDLAEAEPAVPGWRMAVDDLFEEAAHR